VAFAFGAQPIEDQRIDTGALDVALCR